MKRKSGMANRLHLESAGRSAGEGFTGGVLDGLRVTNRFDQFQRRTNLALINSQGAVLATTDYGYDTASRFQSVSKSGNTATYSYLANSPLIEQVVFKQGTTTRMSTSKSYDKLNRLTSAIPIIRPTSARCGVSPTKASGGSITILSGR
jgi:hypothetical protein